jgi:hypothetical protein
VEAFQDPKNIHPIHKEPFPYVDTHPASFHFQIHNGTPDKGALYVSNLPDSPSAEV